MLFGRGSIMPHLETGKLRGIATTGTTRSMPALPTMAETLPDFDLIQWYGILVPAATPRQIVTRLQKEIAIALARPKVAQSYVNASVEPGASTPEQFASLIDNEIAKYAKVMKLARIKAE
jgi:tripartite-type tricarboxylate transporter receptor subunit TctC